MVNVLHVLCLINHIYLWSSVQVLFSLNTGLVTSWAHFLDYTFMTFWLYLPSSAVALATVGCVSYPSYCWLTERPSINTTVFRLFRHTCVCWSLLPPRSLCVSFYPVAIEHADTGRLVYANTLLATLNTREYLRKGLRSDTPYELGARSPEGQRPLVVRLLPTAFPKKVHWPFSTEEKPQSW